MKNQLWIIQGLNNSQMQVLCFTDTLLQPSQFAAHGPCIQGAGEPEGATSLLSTLALDSADEGDDP